MTASVIYFCLFLLILIKSANEACRLDHPGRIFFSPCPIATHDFDLNPEICPLASKCLYLGILWGQGLFPWGSHRGNNPLDCGGWQLLSFRLLDQRDAEILQLEHHALQQGLARVCPVLRELWGTKPQKKQNKTKKKIRNALKDLPNQSFLVHTRSRLRSINRSYKNIRKDLLNWIFFFHVMIKCHEGPPSDGNFSFFCFVFCFQL